MATAEEVFVESFKARKGIPPTNVAYWFASGGNDGNAGVLPSAPKLEPKDLIDAAAMNAGDAIVVIDDLDIGAKNIQLPNNTHLFGLDLSASIVRSNDIDLQLTVGAAGACMVMGGANSRIEDIRIRADWWDSTHFVVPFGSKLVGSPRNVRCRNVHFFSAGRWAVFHQENINYGVIGDWTFTDCAFEAISPVKLRTSHQHHVFNRCKFNMDVVGVNYQAGWNHYGLEVNYDGNVQLYDSTFNGLFQNLDADYRENTDIVTAVKLISDWGTSAAYVFLHGCNLDGVINDGTAGYRHLDNSGSGGIVVNGSTQYDSTKTTGTISYTEPSKDILVDTKDLQENQGNWATNAVICPVISLGMINDTLRITAWLQRDGRLVTAPTSCVVTIFDADMSVHLLVSSHHPTAAGYFVMQRDNPSFTAGENYTAQVSIVSGGTTYTAAVPVVVGRTVVA